MLDEQCTGKLLYCNRDFYCVKIHDKEVACDGILFHNVFEVPVVYASESRWQSLQLILAQMAEELQTHDTGTEEMLCILLKQIIITCTRVWKQQHRQAGEEAKPEVEFSRQFSQLAE